MPTLEEMQNLKNLAALARANLEEAKKELVFLEKLGAIEDAKKLRDDIQKEEAELIKLENAVGR